MSNPVDIAFIIVSYNTRQFLKNLLEFFLNLSDLPFSYSIIVVDNCSSDGSVEFLRLQPGVTSVINDENIGYGRAANKGVEISEGRYVCVLNTDVILNRDALIAIWNFMETSSYAGVCSPVICYPDKRIQGFIFKFNILLNYSFVLSKAYGKAIKLALRLSHSPMTVDGVMGAFIFLRRSLLAGEKMFDEDFFFYYEDTDLAHRLNSRGVITVVLPSCHIIHLGGGGGSKNWRLFHNSKYLYINKHYGERHARAIAIMDYVRANIKSAFYRILSVIYSSERILNKKTYYADMAKDFNVFSQLSIRQRQKS